MKRQKASFNKYKHLSNSSKLKSIISIFTIGAFIFLGFASILEVQVVDCEFYDDPRARVQFVLIEILDKETGKPIENQSIEFTIEHYQKVPMGTECAMELTVTSSQTLNFGQSGVARL